MSNLAIFRAGPETPLRDMPRSAPFYASILDSMAVNIVAIDRGGVIQYVNSPWIEFASDTGLPGETNWRGINYLELCDRWAFSKEDAQRMSAGIRKVLSGQRNEFSMEYPIRNHRGKRWFAVTVTPLQWEDQPMFVIGHQDITQRKRSEQRMKRQSLIDKLTGIANRQYFDDFLDREWRRSMRNGHALSLVMLDIDFFKRFNDTYGRPAGDECLRKIGSVLQGSGRRGGDLAARYGGEEFALVMTNCDARHVGTFATSIVTEILALKIPHACSDAAPFVTTSAGVATMPPAKDKSEGSLIDAADKALYKAKHSGRNRVCTDVMH